MNETICLLNDSFPPVIDGVANAVVNYAQNLYRMEENPVVITPEYPGADDTPFPYPILRYPALDLRNRTAGYMAGIPFAPELLRQLEGKQVGLLHSHCPIVSNMLGRELRQVLDVPLVMTYQNTMRKSFPLAFSIASASRVIRRPLYHMMRPTKRYSGTSSGRSNPAVTSAISS